MSNAFSTSTLKILVEKGIRLAHGVTKRWRRIPVILQMNSVECGASCLAMVLNYFGYRINLAECRQSFTIGRGGTNAQEIARVAQEFGLLTKAYSIQASQLDQVRLPIIAHWNNNHFVIIERVTATKATIIDPAIGRIEIGQPAIQQSLTGTILAFQPGSNFSQRRIIANPMWRNYLSALFNTTGAKTAIAQVLLASLVIQIVGLGGPLLTKVLIDYVLPLHITDIMVMIAIGVIVIVFFQTTARFLREALLIHLQAKLDAKLSMGVFDHLLSLPLSFFSMRPTGDLIMRLNSNSVIREILMNQTLSVILDGSLTIVYLLILATQELSFAFLTMGLASVQIIVLAITAQRVNRLSLRDLSAQAETQSYLVESLTGIDVVKSHGLESKAFDKWSHLFLKQINISIQRSFLSTSIDTFSFFFRTFSALFLTWYGVYLVLHTSMNLGTMLALTGLASAAMSPLSSLISKGQRLQFIGAYFARIGDIVKTPPEQSRTANLLKIELHGSIRTERIHFHYEAEKYVLKDISLHIEAGQKIAIVGKTGSGKSTLAFLLLGLYKPQKGNIFIDDISIAQLDLQNLRRQFGVVLQNPYLFNTSIRENISFSSPNLPLEEIIGISKLVALHKDIMEMPMQYETPVAEGGSGLSGGQRQRIALAQALATQPSILLLDEATSHLDAVTEAKIDKNLDALQCTRIVIAHRLSTIRNADQILVLSAGKIAEKGNHEQLMRQGKEYAHLVYQQMDGELSPAQVR